jgi:3'-phosphoadenosine 5'-phosphosulfate (PAPS) 3'-phosphatase
VRDEGGRAPFAAELATAIAAAEAGATEIRRFYGSGTTASAKRDGSPVTEADLASDAAIRARLRAAFPADAILTEEGADDPGRLAARRVWVVDPLDGTKQFVGRTDDFDVLVALVVDGRPAVAVSHHPPSGRTCAAVAGQGAWTDGGTGTPRRPLRFAPVPPGQAPRVVTSVWYGARGSARMLERATTREDLVILPTVETGFNPRYWAAPGVDPSDRPFDAFLGWVPEGWLAGGEWDLVVTDLIVREAGGTCTDLWDRPHRYNKPVARNAGGIVIASDPMTHDRLLAALSPDRPHPSA